MVWHSSDLTHCRPASPTPKLGGSFSIRNSSMGAPYEHDYWLACAEKAYACVEGMEDPGARLTMLPVAKGYECLARFERERSEFPIIIRKRHLK
jgi:hypothetical protein